MMKSTFSFNLIIEKSSKRILLSFSINIQIRKYKFDSLILGLVTS